MTYSCAVFEADPGYIEEWVCSYSRICAYRLIHLLDTQLAYCRFLEKTEKLCGPYEQVSQVLKVRYFEPNALYHRWRVVTGFINLTFAISERIP
jgi:hypothetical protein